MASWIPYILKYLSIHRYHYWMRVSSIDKKRKSYFKTCRRWSEIQLVIYFPSKTCFLWLSLNARFSFPSVLYCWSFNSSNKLYILTARPKYLQKTCSCFNSTRPLLPFYITTSNFVFSKHFFYWKRACFSDF